MSVGETETTLPRVGSSFVDDIVVDDSEENLDVMTKGVATKNLTLLAAFMEHNHLGIKANTLLELVLNSQEEDNCVWPSSEGVARLIEVSFAYERKNRQGAEIPTSLEEDALKGLLQAIEAQKKRQEFSLDLEKVAERLKKKWPGLPQVDSTKQLAFKSSLKENVQEGVQESPIRNMANSSTWPAAQVLETKLETSPAVTKKEDPVEEVAEKAANFILTFFGASTVTTGGSLGFGV